MQLILHSIWIWPIIAFIGACFGSFISLVSYRIPHDMPWMLTRSQCPVCHTKLGLRDLMPVLSYLLSGRKCRHCSTPMSVRYVLMELGAAAAMLALFWLKGPTYEFLILAGLAICIITLIVTDLEHYMIPDTVQIGIFLLGIAYVFNQELPLDDRLMNALILGGLGAALHYGYFFLMGRHGLGFGDVKLLAAMGVWMELAAVPVFLLLAGVLGIVSALIWRAAGWGEHFPFGPALILSMVVFVLYPDAATFFHLLVPHP